MGKEMGKGMEKQRTEKGADVAQKAEKAVGVVQIADDVVAMIASLAALEVEGVCSMAGNITSDLISRTGIKKLSKGVKVIVTNRNVRVDIALIVEYGYNIPAACHKVQAKVKTAIETMTGLSCSDVNIRIAGIRHEKI